MKNIGKVIAYGLGFGSGGLAIGLIIGGIRSFVRWEGESVVYGVFIGLVAGAVFGIIFGIIRLSRDEKERLREIEAAELKRIEYHKEGQQKILERMLDLSEQSIILFESMPKHLDSAEQWLNRAETDFAEGAFIPFWEAIEEAANSLARFNRAINQINDNSSSYVYLTADYEATPPKFALTRKSVEKLSVGTATAERMNAIVRAAQRNYQFTNIYLQRKTNQILVEGFDSLEQALGEMTWRITTSVDDLAGSVHDMTSTLDGSLRAIHSTADNLAEMTKRHHNELMEKASETAERERIVLEMLDNIQRGRRISP